MDKSLRVWIDGELLTDGSVAEGEAFALPGRWQKTVEQASERGQPWRVEFGDQGADVMDGYWLG
jgi:hypothetical protein